MENSTSFLDLNEYCKLEIIKYIIADCELRGKFQSNKMKYLDLVSFALAHEDLEAVLKLYHNDLYTDLEFLFVTNREYLEIDFAKLQSTHKGKAGDAFWRFFANAIRENSRVQKVYLFFKPESFQPDFLDHFQMIKFALENKKSISLVDIALNGYSLDDLNNFGHLKKLVLSVRVSAEALATICKSNPELNLLKFMSTESQGRLSDIVPHCRNLEVLGFVAKPDVDGAEYAPLAQLPNLYEMTIQGAFKNGLLLETIQKWKRPETDRLKMYFSDCLLFLSSVTLPRKNLLRSLNTIKDTSHSVCLIANYNFLELTADIDRTEEFHATFTVIEGVNLIVANGVRRLTVHGYMASTATELASQIKVFNVNFLDLLCSEENTQAQLVKLFELLHPEGSFALRTLYTDGQALDQFGTSELVKIHSIQDLKCTFTYWESVKHLSKLINLQKIQVFVKEHLEEESLQALCNFLNYCHVNLNGSIICNNNWIFRLNANQIALDISSNGSAENLLRRKLLSDLQRNLRHSWYIQK